MDALRSAFPLVTPEQWEEPAGLGTVSRALWVLEKAPRIFFEFVRDIAEIDTSEDDLDERFLQHRVADASFEEAGNGGGEASH